MPWSSEWFTGASLSAAQTVRPCENLDVQQALAYMQSQQLERSSAEVRFFRFTLRKADGMSLGLDLNVVDIGGSFALVIRTVQTGGAIESWNRQCTGGVGESRVVTAGDIIAQVNDRIDCKGMLDVCRQDSVLKFLILSGWGSNRQAAPPWQGSLSAESMYGFGW